MSLASQQLLSRLAPVRAGLPDATWCQLVQAAHAQGVELSATHMFSPLQDPRHYDIWGVAAAEVQVDLLAGTTQVRSGTELVLDRTEAPGPVKFALMVKIRRAFGSS